MSRKMLFTMFAAMSISLVGCAIDDKDEDEEDEDEGEDTDSSTDEDDGGTDEDDGGTDDEDDGGGETCDEGSCEDCQQCALSDECADEYDDCSADNECIDFATCAGECGATDQECFEECAASYPNGAAMYNELVICVICDECYDTCDGAGSGC
jgi:hypothetical protein